MTDVDSSLLARYGFSPAAQVTPLAGGLINQTFLVAEADRSAVLQRLHPIFRPELHFDIAAITAHLANKGVTTPRLLSTRSGALFVQDARGQVWRMLTFLRGRTFARVESPAIAHSAGHLVGRFHVAVSDLRHTFHFTRPGAHDTPAHLEKLRLTLEAQQAHPRFSAVAQVGDQILQHARALDPLPTLPTRIIHGDLKIGNLLFDLDTEQAIALLDLDTMAELTIPVELGDALRSWCNPAGEDEAAAHLQPALFEAAIHGYAESCRSLLSETERASIVLGVETIALELASRFAADALLESYFGWDPARYATRGEHNLVRAKSQLSVARSVRSQRARLERICLEALH